MFRLFLGWFYSVYYGVVCSSQCIVNLNVLLPLAPLLARPRDASECAESSEAPLQSSMWNVRVTWAGLQASSVVIRWLPWGKFSTFRDTRMKCPGRNEHKMQVFQGAACTGKLIPCPECLWRARGHCLPMCHLSAHRLVGVWPYFLLAQNPLVAISSLIQGVKWN